MSHGNSTSYNNGSLDLLDCECNKMDRLVSGWTSQTVWEDVKKRLLTFTDPVEVFARMLCILYWRIILDGTVQMSKENFNKSLVALTFATSFGGAEYNYCSLTAAAWDRFYQISGILDKNLSNISSRRLMGLEMFVEEVFGTHFETNNRADVASLATSSQAAIQPTTSVSSDFGSDWICAPSCSQEASVENDRTRSTPSSLSSWADLRPMVEQTVETIFNKKIGPGPVKRKRGRPSLRETDFSQDGGQRPVQFKKKQEPVRQSGSPMSTAESTVEGSAIPDDRNSEQKRKGGRPTTRLWKPDDLRAHYYLKGRTFYLREDIPPGGTSNPAQNLVTKPVDRTGWHKCPMEGCNRTMKYDWLLNSHVDKHSRYQETYWCDQCGYTSASTQSMGAHMNAHGNHQYACEFCDFRYTVLTNLKKHRKNCHPEEIRQLPLESSDESEDS